MSEMDSELTTCDVPVQFLNWLRADLCNDLVHGHLSPELATSIRWVLKKKLEPKLLNKGGMGSAGWLGDETTAKELRAVLDPPKLQSLLPSLTRAASRKVPAPMGFPPGEYEIPMLVRESRTGKMVLRDITWLRDAE